MILEDVLLWCVYVAALQAQKQRKHAHITTKRSWHGAVNTVRTMLDGRGYRL